MEENNIKTIKIGKKTFGITFIFVGIIILLQLFIKQDIFKYVMIMWPLVLISLGVETLYYSYKKDVNIKYDVLGVLLSFFIIIIGSGFGLVNFGITKISNYSNLELFVNRTCTEYFSDEDTYIVNLADKEVSVKIKESDVIDTPKVTLNLKSNKDKLDGMLAISGKYSIYEFINIRESSDKNKIEIYDFPDWVENLEIVVYKPSNLKVECTGNINIKN